MKITVDIEIVIKTEKEFPSFYENIVETDDPRTDVEKIGNSTTNPLQFYVFTHSQGPNGSYAASFNILPVIQQVMGQFPPKEEQS